MPLGAALAGLPVAALWVVLTAATGKTYHLAPLIAAALPGVLAAAQAAPRGAAGRSPRRTAALAAVAGGLAVAAGWAAIVAAEIEPTATLVAEQPGGVTGEVVAGAIAGAAAGAAFVMRAPRAGPGG